MEAFVIVFLLMASCHALWFNRQRSTKQIRRHRMNYALRMWLQMEIGR